MSNFLRFYISPATKCHITNATSYAHRIDTIKVYGARFLNKFEDTFWSRLTTRNKKYVIIVCFVDLYRVIEGRINGQVGKFVGVSSALFYKTIYM